MSRKGITLYFDEELIEAINKYRVSMGWTWNRIFLYGVAMSIQTQGKNDDLLLAIADYLENKR